MFNTIWVKVVEHKYIYITEIKFEKDIPFKRKRRWKYFLTPSYANLC